MLLRPLDADHACGTAYLSVYRHIGPESLQSEPIELLGPAMVGNYEDWFERRKLHITFRRAASFPGKRRSHFARCSGSWSLEGAVRLRAAWTGCVGWGRLKPQGCLGATASAQPIGESWRGNWTNGRRYDQATHGQWTKRAKSRKRHADLTELRGTFVCNHGATDMGDKGRKDKGKKEQQKKAQLNPKEKRKLKKEKKTPFKIGQK